MARTSGRPWRALLHFLWIGGLAALIARAFPPEPDPIALERSLGAVSGAFAGPLDEEILYREGLARGLGTRDPVVRLRLAQNAAFLGVGAGADGERALRELGMARGDVVVRRRVAARMRAEVEAPVRAAEPGRAALAAFLAAHPARFEVPRRVAFRHAFFSDARRADPAADARSALARWERAGEEPAGDGSLARREQPLQSEADLARYFGAAFGARLFELPLETWAGPVPAPGGVHLVRVVTREPARVPPLEEIGPRVRAALLDERADAAVRAFVAERLSGSGGGDARTDASGAGGRAPGTGAAGSALPSPDGDSSEGDDPLSRRLLPRVEGDRMDPLGRDRRAHPHVG